MFSKKFIQATETYCTYEKPVNAPYVRKTFVLDELPDKATVTLTCTGFYRLWVNGKEVSDSRLNPGIVNPDQTLFYDTYDVKALLQTGRNVLALILGNGMADCMGGFIWDFDKAVFRSAPKLALSFETEKNGESAVLFEADEQFVCEKSPIVFDDLRSGEFYDARLETDGWNLPDFDDSTWTPAIPTQADRGLCFENQTDKVVVTKELKPLKIYKGFMDSEKSIPYMRPNILELTEKTFYQPEFVEKGYVFEYAENSACVPKLRIKGKKGQKIVIQASEYCAKDGEVCISAIQSFYPFGFCQRDVYTCKGEGTEEYVPSFTYHGARYFFVTGLEESQVSEDTLTMLVQNSDLAEIGNFTCSDPIAQKLQNATRVSDLANFVYFPTDCPHREKNGWTGDAAVSAEHMIQNLDTVKSWHQWLKMIGLSQRYDGALSGITPTTGWGYDWGNGPVWDQVLIELPYQAYVYRGNLDLFRDVADYILRYIHYLSKKRLADGSLCFGLGDWCHCLREDAHNYLCPTEVSDTVTAYSICKKAAFLYDKIGMHAQSTFAENMADEFLHTVRTHFIDWNTFTVRGDCQCAQALALYHGVFKDGERAEAYQRLLELVHEADDHFDCGMLGVRVLFRTLADFGDGELAYKMITRTDAPSYGIWVKDFDLVSLAESFHTTVDGYTTSLNHHFMGDISGFFIKHIAGLHVNPYRDNPGFVRVTPCFVEPMQYAGAYYKTVVGNVRVKWERDGKKLLLHIEKDQAVVGEIALPHGYVFETAQNQSENYVHGRRMLALSQGTYSIVKK